MTAFAEERGQVLAACLELADRGFLAGTGGNVALRAGAGRFAVTPSGLDYYAMTADDICVLDLATLAPVAGSRTPSVESGLHARMFRARPEIQASVHTHQPLASAVALLGLAIELAPGPDRDALGPRIEAVGYGPSGTGFLVRALGRRLGPDCDAYLLRNHGLICAGRTLEAAVANAGRVERAAAQFLRSAIARAAQGDLAGQILPSLSPAVKE